MVRWLQPLYTSLWCSHLPTTGEGKSSPIFSCCSQIGLHSTSRNIQWQFRDFSIFWSIQCLAISVSPNSDIANIPGIDGVSQSLIFCGSSVYLCTYFCLIVGHRQMCKFTTYVGVRKMQNLYFYCCYCISRIQFSKAYAFIINMLLSHRDRIKITTQIFIVYVTELECGKFIQEMTFLSNFFF